MRRKNTKSHGLSNTRLYKIFHGMHKRCNNPKCEGYQWYGGRGIKVCDKWNRKDGFLSFYAWAMANGYQDNLSIDRIDYDADYSPENCRWVDAQTQANNSRWNTVIEYNGEKHTMADWGRIRNISPKNLSNRLNNLGWTIEEALEFKKHITPHKDEVLYTINGETHNIREWCKIRHLSVNTVRYRREQKWTPEEIFGFKERTR